jgi:hypothetical protein
MRRRDALQLLAAAAAAPMTAAAQTTGKTYRLASFTSGSPVAVDSPNGRRLIPTGWPTT